MLLYLQAGEMTRGVMAKVLNNSLEINQFQLQFPSYIHFRSVVLGKGMNSSFP